ncbi:hypothetical protein bthur0003_8840 [Bacillus thuringiensis serovar thuringiensis str. T01001]|nr:hypothetical protein H175_233p158 [Bacillus thuringiensis serovar thuringiensis str. IS5056]EEM36571.1 hypothetical protein bthur0003_8840 [Bacillus thuringiensis serovar thuringiensis str. T01001]
MFINDAFISGVHTSRYKRKKAMQTNEKTKDHRFILCFIGFTPLLSKYFY